MCGKPSIVTNSITKVSLSEVHGEGRKSLVKVDELLRLQNKVQGGNANILLLMSRTLKLFHAQQFGEKFMEALIESLLQGLYGRSPVFEINLRNIDIARGSISFCLGF